MPLMMLARGRCQFCHGSNENTEDMIGGDSSFICRDCVAQAGTRSRRTHAAWTCSAKYRCWGLLRFARRTV